MNESTARVERFQRHAVSPSYLWNVPEKPFSVRLSLSLVDRLEHEVVEAFRSVTSRGSEVGGLLLGHVVADTRPVVVLEDYELVECDYARGPLYRLSDGDKQRFITVLERRADTGGGLAVIGFFRSHTRKGLSLDPEDVGFHHDLFPDPLSIALLVRPFATRTCVAGIFVRENGEMNGDASALEFPLSRKELLERSEAAGTLEMPEMPAIAEPAQPVSKPPGRAQIVPIASRREVPPPVPEEPEPIAQTVAESKPEPPTPAPPPPPAPVTEPPALAGTATLAAAAPAPSAPTRATAEPAQATPEPVKTESEPAEPAPAEGARASEPVREMDAPSLASFDQEPAPGSRIKLWLGIGAALLLAAGGLFFVPGLFNSKRPAVTQPGSGLALRIERTGTDLMLTWNRDSDTVRTATHALLQVNDGEQHEKVEMDLSQLRTGSIVYSPATSDVSFRLEVSSSDPAKSLTESVRVLKTKPSAIPPEDNQSTAAPKQPVPVTPEAASAAAESEPEQPAPPKVQPKPFNVAQVESPAARLRPARNEDLPEPPPAGGPPQLSGRIPGASSVAAPPVSMPSPVAPAAPQPSTPAPSAAARTAAAPPTKVGGQVIPVELISRVEPQYPPLARQAGVAGEVLLEAVVGPNGRVTDVKMLSGHPLLREAAGAAVRKWTYRPAKLNGQPVESRTQVRINFLKNR